MAEQQAATFELKNPEDAKRAWLWDSLHCPRPLPPLAMEGALTFYESGTGFGAQAINGYVYMSPGGPPAPTIDLPPSPYPDAMQTWERHYLPMLQAILETLRTRDYDALTAEQLAARLPGYVEESVRALACTMAALGQLMGPSAAFVGFCAQHFGPDGPIRAMTMLQGFANESSMAGEGLGALANRAAGSPALRQALRTGKIESLETVAGGKEFLAAFRRYLDDYGWGTQTWFEVYRPTWREDPSVPLRIIARYAEDREHGPQAAHERAVAMREQTVRETESMLPNAEAVAAFRELFAAAASYVPVIEGRARWQLAAGGLTRLPALALGRKLVAGGKIAEPNDVFFLGMDELPALALAGAQPAKSVVKERQAELEKQRGLQPVPMLGTPPPPETIDPGIALMFGFGIVPSTDIRRITGIAASKGVARGRARVIIDLDDSDRLEAGDVLVCPFTAPPWTPLFAIASAVVTNAGGVLSHSAIAAREYAIPCVTGTQIATSVIPDGAWITVDGTEGVVRVEA